MAEYIKREAAIAYIREKSEECQKAFEELGGESGIYADAYNDLAEDFYSIPAADVAPVVHGRPCVKTRTVQMTGYHEELGTRAADGSTLYRKAMAHVDVPYEYCPVCGATLCSRWRNYCGKCGAKMDGGADDAAD